MGKKSKKVKDPSAPKPPLNAYLEFSQEERGRILLETGHLSTTEVAKEVGLRWRNLSLAEKEKFEQKFRVNKANYLILKLDYEKNVKNPETEPQVVVRKTKKKKDPLAPKQPLSSFMEFAKEERPKILSELGSIPLKDVGIELGKRWRSLAIEDRQVFDLKSKENRARYEKEKQISSKQVARLISDSDPQNTSKKDDSLPADSDPLPEEPSSQAQSSQAAHLPSSSQSGSIVLSDLGFAQQKKFPWHPALKTGDLAGGTRVKVTFFGTGQSGVVDKSKWVVFSVKSEDRIKTPNLMKCTAFKNGLEQMKNVRDKIRSDLGSSVTAPGIDFTPQIGGRKFRSLNKDHLQREEEENMNLMEKKMRQEVGSKLWTCRDCPWKGRFAHKAKAHARGCGQRKRVHSKKSKEKKFSCSNGSCGLSFALRKQLVHHYRYYHHYYLLYYSLKNFSFILEGLLTSKQAKSTAASHARNLSKFGGTLRDMV